MCTSAPHPTASPATGKIAPSGSISTSGESPPKIRLITARPQIAWYCGMLAGRLVE